jgi:hypothetical protein
MPTKHRAYARKAVRVECQVVRERDFRLLADTTIDLSAVGMRVSAGLADIGVGDALLVSFRGTETGGLTSTPLCRGS